MSEISPRRFSILFGILQDVTTHYLCLSDRLTNHILYLIDQSIKAIATKLANS